MAAPTLDVNDAFGPEFLDDILVNRIDEQIDGHGRVIRTSTQFATRAVVLPTSPDDLARLPEEEYTQKSIALYSPFRFQSVAQSQTGSNQQPDEVIWHGSTYVVRLIDDYAGYGRGFVHAIAVSIDAVDPPPPSAAAVAVGHA